MAVLQYDHNGMLLKRHSSLSQAARSIGMKPNAFCYLLRKKGQHDFHGSVWYYENEILEREKV
jgi:hypothetical protein